MEGLDIESLDVQDAEILNAPTPEAPAAEPAPVEPEAKAEPVIETAERARDPATGKFVSAATEAPAPVAETPVTAQPTTGESLQPVSATKPEGKVIPLAAHLEERNRWRQELQASNQRIEEINKRLEELTPKAPEPDFLEDPKGYVDAKTTAAHKEVEALKQEAEGLRQQQAFVNFKQQVGTAEAVFVEKNPDYYEAINHVRTIRLEQLRDLYPEEPEERLVQAIASEELQAAQAFIARGRNPAEVAYKMAQTFGYRAKKAEPAAIKMPPVPKAPVGDPGSTLGSSGGDNPEEFNEMGENDLEPFEAAISERFGAKRG